MTPSDTENDQIERKPSKTQRKKEMTALQSLGEKLVDLSDSDLAKLPLSERLRDALQLAKSLRAHGAIRRQKQLIGKLMRNEDADSISQAIEAHAEPARASVVQMHAVEKWRDKLLESPDTALAELASSYPKVDQNGVRALITQSTGKDSVQSRTAKRTLFRLISDLMNAPSE